MGDGVQVEARACFVDQNTGGVVETTSPDPALTPNLFGVYMRPSNSDQDWVWCADFATYEYFEFFIDAFILKFHNDGSGFDLDLRHIAQFIHR